MKGLQESQLQNYIAAVLRGRLGELRMSQGTDFI